MENKKAFFLFGELAVEKYNESGEPNLEQIKDLVDNGDASLFFFEENITTPTDLLLEYDGYMGFAEITEVEYKFLSGL